MKKILIIIAISQLFLSANAFSSNLGDAGVGDLVLPTEVRKLPKKSGAIYYSKSVKNKALIPTNFWGEVHTSGLHFIPQGTTLIKGLSLAGGPKGTADISEVQVQRNTSKGFKTLKFDLENGGDIKAHTFPLKPGDVVFIKKDRFYENRNYYTTLLGVLATVISTSIIYDEINN